MNKLDELLADDDAKLHRKLGSFVGLFPADHPIRARVAGCDEAVKAMAPVTPCSSAKEALRKVTATTQNVDAWHLRVADAVREAVEPPPPETTTVMQRRINASLTRTAHMRSRQGRPRGPNVY